MNDSLKCSECAYFPSNCSYLNKVHDESDSKVYSLLYRFMENSCKYFIWRVPLEGVDKMYSSKGVRCIDCRYYPNDCSYWKKGRRDKGGNAVTEPDPKLVHGCKDYLALKGGEENNG